MAEISATDSDSTVNSGAITNGGAAGITLDGFTPAPGDGGVAEATLQVSDAVEAGIYQVDHNFWQRRRSERVVYRGGHGGHACAGL